MGEHSHDEHEGGGHSHGVPSRASRLRTRRVAGAAASADHGHEHAATEHDEHAHGHGHGHGHDATVHEHEHRGGLLGFVEKVGLLHGHSHAVSTDNALESSEKGIRIVKVSLVLLAATAVFQIVIVAISGSVALLADTIHNFTDALTALPLWLAFILGRRAASRRYTYGFGRTEDLAGIFIVAVIFLSALLAGYESIVKLLDPQDIDYAGLVMGAAVIGFIGNETVATMRIRVGREIGSAALEADGQHARVDGLTSLAVLVGAIGVVLGAPIADPLIGLVITVAILFITKDAAVLIWHRLLDATDPVLLETMEQAAQRVVDREAGAQGFTAMRLRWLGHRLQVEMVLLVDADLPTRESHRIAEEMRHELFHSLPGLGSALIHVDPWSAEGPDAHSLTEHHR
jgi:cation diffusion facilitator family transporter